MVDAGLSSGAITVTDLGSNTPAVPAFSSRQATSSHLYVATAANQTITIPSGGGYFLDSVGGALTVDGSATGGDTVLGSTAVNSPLTYIATGGDNQITFIANNNLYDAAGATVGGDTVVTGSGHDTVKTGVYNTTVFAGTGNSAIFLNDTGANTSVSGTGTDTVTTILVNDKVWIHDGSSTIFANGTSDVIGIDAPTGQLIYGGTNASAFLSVLLNPTDPAHTDGTSAGNNTVVAGAGTTTVYAESSDNSIFGGSGILYIISGTNVSDSVVAGTGAAYIFGASGVNIAAANATGDTAGVYFVASAGTESYYGGNATANQYIFGNNPGTVSGAGTLAAAINETLTGGSGNDLLVAGAGNETLYGGSGNNTFLLTDPAEANAALGPSHILLADFGTAGDNSILFDQATFPTAADYQAAIQNGTAGTISIGGTTYNDFTVTFSDQSTVTFVGVNNAAAIESKIVS